MEKEGLIGSGILASYAETTVFLEDFAEDRMSDLITNIIRDQLAKYTVEQCEYHGIPLTNDKENVGVYWDLEKQQWLDCYSRALYVEGKLTLLVPKRLVARRYISTASNYVQQVIFGHRKRYHENSYGSDSRSLDRRVYIQTRKRHEIKPPSNVLLTKEEIKKPGLNVKKYAIIHTENNLEYITEFKDWISMTLGKENNYTLNNQSLYDFIERHRKREM